jgi:hypothetical protein
MDTFRSAATSNSVLAPCPISACVLDVEPQVGRSRPVGSCWSPLLRLHDRDGLPDEPLRRLGDPGLDHPAHRDGPAAVVSGHVNVVLGGPGGTADVVAEGAVGEHRPHCVGGRLVLMLLEELHAPTVSTLPLGLCSDRVASLHNDV